MTTTRHASAPERSPGLVRPPAPRHVLPLLSGAFVSLAVAALLAWPARESLYGSVAGGTAASPLAGLAGLVADKGLLLLLAVTAWLAVLAWFRDRRAFWLLAAAGAGTVTAYATSELVKAVVTEERPCRVIDVATVLACPPPGDWSWPSNHATIAGALAVACLVVAPRLWPVVVPLALAVAGARVAAGVHYVHDVVSGLAVAVLVTGLVTVTVHASVERLRTRRAAGRLRTGRTGRTGRRLRTGRTGGW